MSKKKEKNYFKTQKDIDEIDVKTFYNMYRVSC